MSQWHGGKGSGARKGADQNKYADNWDKIFSKKSEENDKSLISNEKKSEENVKKGLTTPENPV